MAKTFITCAITGASPMPKHPNFPFRPEHVAQEALDAAEAGASIIHVHVRHPETGAPNQELENYRQVVKLIREKNIKFILAEANQPERHANRLADQTGAKVVLLAGSVGELPQTDDYISMFDANVNALVAAKKAK